MTKSPRLQVAFGLALRERRIAEGISQEELADRSELHRTYISQLERGLKAPSLKAIQDLAAALGVPAHRLVEDAERKLASRGST